VEDNERAEFIQNHLDYVKKAMAEGIDVRGYCHWSLIDNFEWSHGFHPHFGLIEVNFDTLAKKPKKSYYKYKEIIERKSF